MKKRGLALVFVDPTSIEAEVEFNEWFDRTHLDEVLGVEGIVAGARFHRIDVPTAWSPVEQHYLTLLEVEADDIAAVAAALRAASSEMASSDTVSSDPRPVVMWFEEQTPRREADHD
jgi:hypothetical protein